MLSSYGGADGRGRGSVSHKHSRKRVNASAACEACQRARIKCSGVIPCEGCIAKGTLCTIDSSRDGRRTRRRTLDALNAKVDALETLLGSLKSLDDSSIRSLIGLIRNDASVDAIVEHVRRIQKDNGPNFNTRVRSSVLDITSLIDEPPIRVPARPWTDVTDNDLAVSHLISVYFTWQHFGYPSVDQDHFVQEMNSKDLNSQYCSPVLVNSMLLAACMYTDHPSAFANPDDTSTRGLHFLDEASRLWTLEQGRVSLSNLQALPAFISGVTILGKDRIGTTFTNQCIHTSSELALEVKKGLKRGNQEFATERFQRSYTFALWAAFLVETDISVGWSKPLDLRKPSKECYFITEELQRPGVWQPYPQQGPEFLFYPSALHRERFKLYTVAADLQAVVLSGNPNDSPLPGFTIMDDSIKLHHLDDVTRRLSEWYQNLPPEAQLGEREDHAPVGPLLDLHLAYNSFRISTANNILRIANITEKEQDDAEAQLMSACSNIAHVFNCLRQSIGLKNFSIYLVHASSLSAYCLLRLLDRPGARDLLHVMVIALSAAYRRWTIAHGIIRMVWIEVQQRGLTSLLDESTLSLLKLSAVDAWGPEDHRLFEKCAYPNYAAMMERGIMLAEMGELLGEYSKMQLEDKLKADEAPKTDTDLE